MTESFTLGPFDVDEQIGEGGMASVYGARHRHTGVPAAIKIVHQVASPLIRRQLHAEVQAHAGLHHRGIVDLFDYGQVFDYEQVGEASAQLFDDAGGMSIQYVAMEFADGGTVRDAMPIGDWPTARNILVQILDALAYAHARGVIHRDLKPANFLVFGDIDSADGFQVKLADFGIAHALNRAHTMETDEVAPQAGTPWYMAPEQIVGQWRDFGPWTDLYALGCFAWEMVCGRPPFAGSDPAQTVTNHITEDRPPLDPRFAVPDRLQDWIHCAMSVDSARRFRRAADALWTLPVEPADTFVDRRQVPDDDGSDHPEAQTTLVPIMPPTQILGEKTDDTVSDTVMMTSQDDDPAAESPSHQFPWADFRPPVPEAWRPAKRKAPAAPLVGTGLGLFGLRQPPFVDREEACDHVWSVLQTVVETGKTQWVFVAGERGTGKSRLAEWIATRAHEVGAASVLATMHGPAEGAAEGISGGLERVFRTAGLKRDQVYAHVREYLSQLRPEEEVEPDARALTEILRPSVEGTDKRGPSFRFASLDHRQHTIVRILRLLTERRPLVVWLDDLQWGREAMSLLDYLRREPEGLPNALFLATLRSDIVAERPVLASRLDDLQQCTVATEVVLDPLSKHYQRELLESLLPLEPQLAERLAERTEGHPLFAMQLLRHWIDRGDITESPKGFRIPEERDVELPEDIHELWMERIERLAGQYPDDAGSRAVEALELAAALGREVVRREWDALLRHAELNAPDDLVGRLVARGLARRTDDGWSFAHGLLVESLARHARSHRRWRRHHRLCGHMLADLSGKARGPDAPRIARHLLKAEEYEAALEPLRDALRHFRIIHNVDEWQRIDNAYQRCLRELQIDGDDHRSIARDLECARLRERETRLGEADELLRRCQTICRRHGWDDFLAETLLQRADIAQAESRLPEAEQFIREALDLFRNIGASLDIGRSLNSLGWICKWKGEYDAALRHLERAESTLRTLHNPRQYASVLFGLASVCIDLNDYRRSTEYARRARQLYEELGDLRNASNCINTLGVVCYFQQDYDQAVRYYEQVVEIDERLGLKRKMLPYYNAGVANVFRGEYRRARPYLEEAIQRAETEDRPGWIATAYAGMLACTAGLGRFEEFDEHLRDVRFHLEQTTMVNRSMAHTLEFAAKRALKAGEVERARRAVDMALDQWRQFGDDDAVKRLEAMVERAMTTEG